ncbi:MAG: 5'-nucleotidase [Desulfurococcales archaeon]|nr:5'-nucleotidase [Desulfurococcales archaeon]
MILPIFLKDLEEFKKVAEKAIECRVVRDKKRNVGKLKARTKRYLYTYVVPLEKLDEVIKSVKCNNIVEISKGKVEEER